MIRKYYSILPSEGGNGLGKRISDSEKKAKELMGKIRPHCAIFLDGKPLSKTPNAKAVTLMLCDETIAELNDSMNKCHLEKSRSLMAEKVFFWNDVKRYIIDNY